MLWVEDGRGSLWGGGCSVLATKIEGFNEPQGPCVRGKADYKDIALPHKGTLILRSMLRCEEG